MEIHGLNRNSLAKGILNNLENQIHLENLSDVEAERHAQNFIHHKHNASEVDILIVLNDDMIVVPNEIIESLPAIVIKVDAEDFIKETHEARKEYTPN